MTPLEAARQLSTADPLTIDERAWCSLCDMTYTLVPHGNGGQSPVFQHTDDCPWLAMPSIVAALEAAERMTAASPFETDRGGAGTCLYCAAVNVRGYPGRITFLADHEIQHDADCPYQALVAALTPEPVTLTSR